MVPLLPHELSDRIIDFLHDDYATLSTVSLTCRSFLPATRYHRFSRLILVGRHIERFNQLLDVSLNVGSFVGTLVLDSGLSGSVRRQLGVKTLSAVLDRTPGLRCVEFRHLKLQEDVMRLVGTVTQLHSLSLVGCHVPSSESFARLLSSLGRLFHLHVEDLSQAEHRAIPDDIQRPRVHVFGATSLDNKTTRQVCAWIIDGDGGQGIRSLYTSVRSKAEAIATKGLIEKLGGTLSEFHMVADAEASLAAVFSDADIHLGCLTGLRLCRLTFKLREMFVSENLSLPWISTLISQLSSNSLSSLAVNIQADNMQDLRALDSECGVRETFPVRFDELDALDWATIDAALNTQRLVSLEQVIVEGVGDPIVFRELLRLRYPALAELVHPIHAQV